MIEWGTILYGAMLSALLAAVALVATGERRRFIVGVGALSTLIAPIAWNAILRATHARQFFTDAPIAVLPASWQDTGSGVFTLAVASLFLGIALRREPAGRVLNFALTAAVVAFLVDIYLY